MTDDRNDNEPERYGVPRWRSALVDAMAASEAAETRADDLLDNDPRLPQPGLMLVDCKACELSKLRYARKVPLFHCGSFICSQCGRQWQYDGDTREWTLVGHAFMDDDDS